MRLLEGNLSNSKRNQFVHLRNYTQYSLSRGALRIEDLVKFCVKEKMPATAITDQNNLFGSLEFCLNCEASGIQPIIGTNLLVKDNKLYIQAGAGIVYDSIPKNEHQEILNKAGALMAAAEDSYKFDI